MQGGKEVTRSLQGDDGGACKVLGWLLGGVMEGSRSLSAQVLCLISVMATLGDSCKLGGKEVTKSLQGDDGGASKMLGWLLGGVMEVSFAPPPQATLPQSQRVRPSPPNQGQHGYMPRQRPSQPPRQFTQLNQPMSLILPLRVL
nr:hypothetical protein [Tanacetum cinerariifolium]